VPDRSWESLSRAGSFSPLVVATYAIFFTIFAIVVTVLPVVKLARLVATHSGFEVPDAFAKSLGDFRNPARTEEDYYYQRDD